MLFFLVKWFCFVFSHVHICHSTSLWFESYGALQGFLYILISLYLSIDPTDKYQMPAVNNLWHMCKFSVARIRTGRVLSLGSLRKVLKARWLPALGFLIPSVKGAGTPAGGHVLSYEKGFWFFFSSDAPVNEHGSKVSWIWIISDWIACYRSGIKWNFTVDPKPSMSSQMQCVWIKDLVQVADGWSGNFLFSEFT